MSKNVKFISVSLHPDLIDRINQYPGYSYRARIEWLLNAVENKAEDSVTKMSYDELVDYVIAQSKLQVKEKVLGLIVGLLKCFL